MNVSLRSFLPAIIAMLAIFLSATTVFAQEKQGLEFRPAIIQETVNPGEAHNYSISFKNVSDITQTFAVKAVDIKGIDDSNTPVYANEGERTPYDLSRWIALSITSVTLAPGESKDIGFSVTIPKDASPGSHFASIFLDSNPEKVRANGSSVAFQAGPIVSLRIAGDANESVQLREFSTGHIVYGSAKNAEFNIRVANNGNTLVRPRGLVEITDMRGAKVDVLKVNDDASGIFPGADRTFNLSWNTYDGFAIGQYRALVSLVYGDDEKKTITAVTSFWVLPLKPILSVLGTIFGGLLVLYVLVRMYIARKIREMGGGRGADLYARRNQSGVPRLLFVTLAILFLAIVSLVLLFLMFA